MITSLILRSSILAGIAVSIGCVRTVSMVNAPPQSPAMRPSMPAMRRQVLNAVDAGDGDYRVRILRDRIIAEPDNLPVRLELADRYQQLGYPELAVEHCRLAAVRFPESAVVRERLAVTLRRSGHLAEAARELEEFLNAHPQQSSALMSWLGIILDESRELTRAESAHRRALVLGPDQDSLHNNLGYNLLLQGKSAEAAACFRRALELNGRSEIARNNLGLAVAGNPKEAVLHWQSISDPATAHSNLAAVLMEQGRYKEARQELDVALGFRKDHAAALANLRLVSEMDGEPATVSLRQAESRWRKLGRIIIGAAPKKVTGAEVESASSKDEE